MSQFNLLSYTKLLQCALESGYRFISFDQVKEGGNLSQFNEEKTAEVDNIGLCLLRHDVDVDLAAATTMARAEADIGVFSTYFLMWRSPCYNLMSRAGQSQAEELLAMGHKIGLHYDQGFDVKRNFSLKNTEDQILQQADWMKTLLNCQISAVSFHQPSQTLLKSGVDCGEMLNTYDRDSLHDFRYISDSNRVFPLWSSNEIGLSNEADNHALANCWPQNIQLLIHPMWWVFENSSTEAVWNRAILSNLKQSQKQLLETERAYGPARKFSIQLESDQSNGE